MKRKTITKTIKRKLEDWLSTIEDKNLREEVKDSLLLTGGSIASMFLKEPVNDYDIYLSSVDTAYKLAKYYASPYSKITVMRGDKRDEYIKEFNAEYRGGIITHQIYNLHEDQVKIVGVAAGFRIEDIPVDKDGKPKSYTPVFFSQNAISLSDDIQIVLRFTGDSATIHKSFDFVHATNYFTFKEGLVTNMPALECLLSKQLLYQGSLYPLTSIIRIKKFLGRGWTISAGEQLKIMYQISKLDLDDFSVLEEQLAGVDVAYFSRLIEILNSMKKDNELFSLNYEIVSKIIDKVFNECDEEN